MDLVLAIIVLIFGYVGIFGIGLTVGMLYTYIYEWRKNKCEWLKK